MSKFILQLLVAHERDKVAKDRTQPDRLREFSLGIIYDAIGWTDGSLDDRQWGTLVEVCRIAEQPKVSAADFLRIRRKLSQAGFSVMPQLDDDNFLLEDEDDD